MKKTEENNHQIIIDGHIVKELRCKNDNCRTLIGYENIMLGAFIFVCKKCGKTSIFKMQYKARAFNFLEKIKEELEKKGGEKNE